MEGSGSAEEGAPCGWGGGTGLLSSVWNFIHSFNANVVLPW